MTVNLSQCEYCGVVGNSHSTVCATLTIAALAERCQKAEAAVKTYEHQLGYHHTECVRITAEYLDIGSRLKKAEARVAELEANLARSHKAVAQWEQNWGEVMIQRDQAQESVTETMHDLLFCPPHKGLFQSDQLEPFTNCVACIRNERNQAVSALQAEKARLDWILEMGCVLIYSDPEPRRRFFSTREAIDHVRNLTTEPSPLPPADSEASGTAPSSGESQ